MKKVYFLPILFCIALTYSSFEMSAQFTDVINSRINFEFRVNESYYGGGNDFFGTADPTIRTDLWVVDQWYGELCSSWNCSAACYSQAADWIWYAGTNYQMTDEFAIWIQAFESDNSDQCQYTDGDDHLYIGYATLRDNQQYMDLVYPSTDFRPCNWNPWLAGNGSQWCFQAVSEWDQIWAQTWRYVHGDSFSDPLNLGTISSGQTKSDINANRAVSTESNAALQYSNTDAQSSADVWYEFTLNEPSQVTISTSHSETDFDTFLTLYENTANFIASDDDSGDGTKSIITRNLCSGTYRINAEGYSTSNGLFKISVAATSIAGPSVADLGVDNASCADATDGYAGWWVNDGVAPFSFYWDGNAIGANSQSNLAPGTYTAEVVDACGVSGTATVTIGNNDTEAPIADCTNAFTIDIVEGETEGISFDDINNGSYDNCGIQNMTVSPTSLNSSDTGANTITLTVNDTNGNQSTCQTNVNVNVVVGLEELETSHLMKVYPNPNSGTFTLDLGGTNFQSGDLLSIFNPVGKLVYSKPILQSKTVISLEGVSPGIYTLSMQVENEVVLNRILIQN